MTNRFVVKTLKNGTLSDIRVFANLSPALRTFNTSRDCATRRNESGVEVILIDRETREVLRAEV